MKKLFVAVSAVLLAWNVWLTYRITNVTTVSEDRKTVVMNTVNGYTTDITKVISDVKSKTVRIQLQEAVLASGIIVDVQDADVYVLTSLKEEPDKKLRIVFDNDISIKAEKAGYDPLTSLTLLKCRPEFTVEPVQVSDASLREAGEYGIAVSGKRAAGSAMVTFGIVSEESMMKMNAIDAGYVRMLEADISVNDFNIGGALVNLSGEVMGILVNRPFMGVEGMGYALSSDEMMTIVREMQETGSVTRGSLDILTKGIDEMSSYEKNTYGIALDQKGGVRVMNSSNILEEELLKGDIILSIDGEPINDTVSLLNCLYQKNKGDQVEIRVLRDEETVLSVVLK